MSKVQELSAKYPHIHTSTFKKFVEADKTPTKKYLDYFLRMWSNKDTNGCPNLSAKLILIVQNFDKLLAYIENKDIYSSEYTQFKNLNQVVENAENIKREKTFERDKHIKVLSESEDYLLLSPITFLGSLKYGSNTKWCTASKENPSFFKKYHKNGFLVYLIDKKNKKEKNYNKIALYCPFGDSEFNSPIKIFNSIDTSIKEPSLYKNGWKPDEFFEFFTIFRYSFYKQKSFRSDKQEVEKFLNCIETLNFNKFQESLKKLEIIHGISYHSNVQDKLELFKEKTNTFYATRTTES